MEYVQRNFLYLFDKPHKYNSMEAVEERMKREEIYHVGIETIRKLSGEIATAASGRNVFTSMNEHADPGVLHVSFCGGKEIGEFRVRKNKGVVYSGLVLDEMLEAIYDHDVVMKNYKTERIPAKKTLRHRSR